MLKNDVREVTAITYGAQRPHDRTSKGYQALRQAEPPCSNRDIKPASSSFLCSCYSRLRHPMTRWILYMSIHHTNHLSTLYLGTQPFTPVESWRDGMPKRGNNKEHGISVTCSQTFAFYYR